MDATELTLHPTNGTDANGTPGASGVPPSSDAPTGSAPLRSPTLHEAVTALPLTGSGDLTRETMQPLADAGDAWQAIRCTVDRLSATRALVEVLRVAATDTEAPNEDTRIGIDALADLIRDQMCRLALVLQGVLDELEPEP